LQSLEAFRGQVVDDIISRKAVYSLNKKFSLNKDYLIKEALTSFDNQLLFAKLQNYREEGFKYTGNDDFAALYGYEINGGIPNVEIEAAKTDIVAAISNFLANKELIERLKSASLLVSQRPLMYKYSRFTVRAVPDLVAFYPSEAPHIFDWKVHTFGVNTYDEQLVSYAYALDQVNKTKPHENFPLDLSRYDITEYRLSECQLLHPDSMIRNYDLTQQRVQDFKDYLSGSIIEIFMAGGAKKYGEVDEAGFDTTYYPENCENCCFKNICNKKLEI
jgi:hypothetical protein